MHDVTPPTIPPRTWCCHAEECWAHDETNPTAIWFGQCWGESSVIDEDYTDDDHWWIHGCEGHPDRFGAYVPPRETPPDLAKTPHMRPERST